MFAVVPAAGHSRRMGQPKLLMPWGQNTVVETVLAQWLAGGVERRVVVVRSDDTLLASACRRAGADVVCPETDPPHMKDSVACALDYIRRRYDPPPHAAWLLAPADMPRLAPAVIAGLCARHDGHAIWVPVHEGRRGHPVAFPWRLADAVFQLGDHEGVNQLLDRYPVAEWQAGEACLAGDLDTPEDYDRQRQ